MTNKDESQRKVPKLRFKGFHDDWEQRKLERLGKIVTGSTPATSIREYYDGCFAFVSPADIQDNRFVESTKTTLTQAGFKRGRQLPSGASLFVSIGSTIGKVGQLKVSATTNQQINALINNSDTDSDFVYSLLEHSSDRLRRFSATQAVPILNKKSFSELRVSTPCLDEQIKIGRLFLVLDNTIALHQRKLELLKKLKQGYLQKLLPQDGRKVPKLRFAQFSGDWEKHELASVVKMVRSYPLSREVEWPSDTGYRYIHYGDIHTGKARIITNSSRLPAILGGNYTPLQEGDIIIADASEDYQEIALPAVLISIKNKERVIAGLHTIAFRPSESLNSLFLYYVLTAPTFRYYGYRMGQGLKVFGISKSNVNKFTIFFPSRTEQSKIVNLLYSLNNTIVMIQKEIDNLKEMKKGYLAHLFI